MAIYNFRALTGHAIAAAGLFLSAPAFGQPTGVSLALPVSVFSSTAVPCMALGGAGFAPGAPLIENGVAFSKSAAILGGVTSQLELLRMQQSGGHLPTLTQIDLTSKEPQSSGFQKNCSDTYGPSRISFPVNRLALPRTDILARTDILGTQRILIGSTPFDTQWRRIAQQGLSARQLTPAIAQIVGDEAHLISQINIWANRSIEYVEDRDLYGIDDYWASASETLRRRQGDCEDIAILKMQMLLAHGIPKENIILTIARDLVRNADHAFLIVRSDNGDLLLDNNTDLLLDASRSHDYRPIMSFSAGEKWLHGYKVQRFASAQS